MPSDLVMIFEPKTPASFIETFRRDREDKLLEKVVAQFPQRLHGQFRIFPYMTLHEDSYLDLDTRTTGFLYTRGEEDNPLTKVDGSAVVKGIESAGLAIPARVISANYFSGKVMVMNPTDNQYLKSLENGLLANYEQIGLSSPPEVIRFILNLDPHSFDRVVKPYLKQSGYNRVEVLEVD